MLNPVRGSEQAGRRPVLVISNEEFNRAMPNVTIVPLTSTKRTLYPAEVLIPKGLAGQPQDSIAMVHQIRTVAKERLIKRWGSLHNEGLQRQIHDALRDHFDLTAIP